MRSIYVTLLYPVLICTILAASQNPEINDQFETTTNESTIFIKEKNTPEVQNIVVSPQQQPKTNGLLENPKPSTAPLHGSENVTAEVTATNDDLKPSFFHRLYVYLTIPLRIMLAAPKVNSVLRNIGTCAVHGAMELISFYFPAPLIPLIASAAGLVIPFEPVVMLRDKMPVTSYRRAFLSAVNSFLSTFDKFKLDDRYDDDPYMMQRFNRRFMNDDNEPLILRKGKYKKV